VAVVDRKLLNWMNTEMPLDLTSSSGFKFRNNFVFSKLPKLQLIDSKATLKEILERVQNARFISIS